MDILRDCILDLTSSVEKDKVWEVLLYLTKNLSDRTTLTCNFYMCMEVNGVNKFAIKLFFGAWFVFYIIQLND